MTRVALLLLSTFVFGALGAQYFLDIEYDDHLLAVPEDQWDRPMSKGVADPYKNVPRRREEVDRRRLEKLTEEDYDDRWEDIHATKKQEVLETTTTTTSTSTTTTTTTSPTTTTTAPTTTTTTQATTSTSTTTETPPPPPEVEIEGETETQRHEVVHTTVTDTVKTTFDEDVEDVEQDKGRTLSRTTALDAEKEEKKEGSGEAMDAAIWKVPRYIAACHTQFVPQESVSVVQLHNGHSHFHVACDAKTDGKVWTIIQKRVDNTVFWNRSYAEYEEGFGNPKSSYWLGLEKIHAIVQSSPEKKMLLRIELRHDICNRRNACSGKGADGFWWGEWEFAIDGPKANYTLHISDMKAGNITGRTDFFQTNNNMPFTTVDRDNDRRATNCARFKNYGGWWHNDCTFVAPNGLYGSDDGTTRKLCWIYQAPHAADPRIMVTYNINPKSTTMMLRPLTP